MNLPDLEKRLLLYIAAEDKILSGSQAYDADGHQVTRADLEVIARQIEIINKKIIRLKESLNVTSIAKAGGGNASVATWSAPNIGFHHGNFHSGRCR